jgi:serine/threonine protein kinase
VVHRDLKISNILVAIDKDKVMAKISDFGLSKQYAEPGSGSQTSFEYLSDEAMYTGSTLDHLAPELLEPQPRWSDKVDIYAFGIILCQLITGQAPYHGRVIISLVPDARLIPA